MMFSDLKNLIEKFSSNKYSIKAFIGARPLSEDGSRKLDTPRLPFNIFPLDYCLAGGIPFNIPVQLFGPPESGKTTLAIRLARTLSMTCIKCCKPLGMCECDESKVAGTVFVGVEGFPPDEQWFNTLRYDVSNNMVTVLPQFAEEAFEVIEAVVKSPECGLVIVDSIGGMLSEEEFNKPYTDDTIGTFSRKLGRFIKRISTVMVDEFIKGHHVSLLFVNQLRSFIGTGFGAPSETVAGGYAFKHLIRLSMRVSQLQTSASDKKRSRRTDDELRNYLRFSVSLLGHQAKQQVFILGGRCEFFLTAAEVDGFPSGAPDDFHTLRSYAMKYGLYNNSKDRVYFEGAPVEAGSVSELVSIFNMDDMDAYMTRYAVVNGIKSRVISERSQHVSDLEGVYGEIDQTEEDL